MKATRIGSALTLLAIVGCASAPASVTPLRPEGSRPNARLLTKPSLVGAWRVVQFCDVDSAGVESYPHGQSPVGIFVYTPTGQLSLHAMRTPAVPPFAKGDDNPTDAERRALLDGYFGYFGTYTITSDSTVTHHVQGGTIPSYIGTEQYRHYLIRPGGANGPDTLSIGGDPRSLHCRRLIRME